MRDDPRRTRFQLLHSRPKTGNKRVQILQLFQILHSAKDGAAADTGRSALVTASVIVMVMVLLLVLVLVLVVVFVVMLLGLGIVVDDRHVVRVRQRVVALPAVDDGLELGQPAHAVHGGVVGHVERQVVVAPAARDPAVELAGAGGVDGHVGEDRIVAVAALGLEFQAAVAQARRRKLHVAVAGGA